MPQQDGFMNSANDFFKRLRNKDIIRVGDNKITSLAAPATKEEIKRRSEFSVFRQYLNQKNWSTKHIELFNEYRKMDDSFPIINAALRLYCLSGDTVVHTPMGDKTILELYEAGKDKSMFYVHTVDMQYRRTQWGMAKYIKYNGKKEVFEVEVERNLDEETAQLDTIQTAKFKCTIDHRIMLADGTFKMLGELSVGDRIFSFYKYTDPSCRCKEDRFQTSKILSVKSVGEEDVYDLVNVEPFSHFSIKLTDTMYVQVHNCQEVCYSLDTNVTLLSGVVKTLQQLIDEKATDFWTWGYDNESKKIVPVKCEKVVSKGFKEVVKVTLDDGTILKCTPDHKQLLKNGEWIETKDLRPGDSLRSIYTQKNAKGYLQLTDGELTNKKLKWKNAHSIVANEVDFLKAQKAALPTNKYEASKDNIPVCHHKSLNKLNNDPTELEWMLRLEHIQFHQKDEEWCKKHSEIMKQFFGKAVTLNGFKNIREFFNFYKPSKLEKVNHTVVSIEFENEVIEVGDIVNAGDVHNWAVTCEDGFIISHNCTKDDLGNIIKIHSDDKKIKKSLEDCFFRNLKINSQGYLLTKEMLKFGNLYCFQNVRKGLGVTDLIHLPPEAIRIELLSNATNLDDFRYNWIGSGGGGGLSFEPWELVHWRNIEDIEMQPYGSSILRSIVDTWRRIVLMREALIIYRVTRAPQRYLFKIDTTGMDPDAALLFADEIKKQLYKKPMVNPTTGEIDWKHNPLSITDDYYLPTFEGDVGGIDVLQGACAKGDTEILTNDGVTTIKQLADEWEDGQKTFVLSCNKYGYITPGRVLWCKETKKVNTLYKVTINNTSVEEFTDNHPFLMEDMTYRRVDELKVGDKIKGIYDKEYTITAIETLEYDSEPVYDLEVEEYHNFALASGIFVHNSNMNDIEDYKIIKDDLFAGLLIPKSYLTFEEDLCLSKEVKINMLDGSSKTILEVATEFSSGKTNYVYSTDEEGNIVPGKVTWAGPTKKVTSLYEITLDNDEVVKCTDNHPFRMRDGSYKRADALVEGDSLMPLYRRTTPKTKYQEGGYEQVWHNGKQKWELTHQLVAKAMDPNFYKRKEDKEKRICHHKDVNKLNNHPDNLQNVSQKEHMDIHREMAYSKNFYEYQKDEMNNIYFNHKVKSIRVIHLEEAEYVYDLTVENYHNFALTSGIFVHNSNKAALAQEDMRFAGAIKQYQSHFIEGLLHIALVHLHTQGFSKDDLENFSIEMNTNSKLVKKLENETLQQQVDLAKSILDTSNGELTLMSFTQVLKGIMQFSDDEIAKTFEDQLIEKKISWRLSQLKEQGFYEEPDQEKKQAMMKRLGDDDVFSNLRFEGKDKLPIVQRILTEKVKQEVAHLTKAPKLTPSSNDVYKIIHVNNFENQIDRVKKDLGLRD